MHASSRWALALVSAAGLAASAPFATAQGIFPAPEQFPDLRLEVAGTVHAIARYNDGVNTYYLIGGDFALVNGAPRRNLARLNANGTLDAAWRADTDGAVNAMALSGDRLFVGGAFANVDGAPRGRLARIDADDGVVDPSWSPMANNLVHALQADSTSVWAAGLFTSIDGTARRMVARIDANTASLPAFNANFAGSVAWALLLDGSDLYIGGEGKVKSSGNQRALMKVAASNGAAINWSASIGPQGGSRVRALAADATTIYAVGRLRRVSNTTRGNGARVLKTSGALQAWNPAADAEIRALALDPATSSVFVGGDFLNLAGHQRLARTDATSGAASGSWNANADRTARALLVDGAQLIAGGSFSRIGTTGAQGGLTRLATSNAAIDGAFLGDAAGRGYITSFAVDANGRVFIGGAFDAVRQDSEVTLYPRQNIARLVPGTYALDQTWSVNVGGEVNAVAVAGADLFVGGNFTTVQGLPRTRLAKLVAATGALDAGWLPTADAPVRNLAVDSNGRLYVAGDFTLLSTTARSGLGRLATTGTGAVDAAWDPAPDGAVDVMLPTPAGIYLGGSFGNVGGLARSGLARVDAGVGAADGFVADVDAAGAVHALTETASGLYVGGVFSSLAGQPRNGTGRISGGVVDAWHPDVGSGDVHAIAVDEGNGVVYLGGQFATAGGASHPNLARAAVAAPGTVDVAWRPGTDGAVVQLGLPAGGGVLAAGGFGLATNATRHGIAAFSAQGSDTSQIVIDSITPVGGAPGSNSVYGQDYVVGWTVNNLTTPALTPSGTVIVTASTGESCGPVAAFTGGCTLTPTGSGPRTVTAVFTGDAQFGDATSAPVAHTVDPATLLLTLATNPYPSSAGAAPVAQITAQVPAPGAANPAGTVAITVNGGAGCSIVLPATSCTLPALAAFGFYDLDATYADAFTPAHHAAAPVSFTHAVGTLTRVTLSVPATAQVGVAVTASVTTTNIPNGATVTVSGGGGCSITINANAGSCQLTFGAAGTTQVTAAFAGNLDLLPAQHSASVAVDTTATTLDVQITPASPFAGQAATLSISTNLAAGASVSIAGAPGCTSIVLPDTDCSTVFAAAGPISVTADFAGNAQFGPASDTTNATVQLNATTLDVQLAPAAPVVGQQIAVTITANLPNGSAVSIAGAPGCTSIVLPSTGCTTVYTAPGLATVTATFPGSSQFGAANDAASVTVAKASATFVDFVATPTFGVPGDTIAFVWEVRALAPGAGTPTGNVTVGVGGNGTAPSCTAPVAAGTCSMPFPAEGSFAMRAVYAGDVNFLAALSGTSNVNILSGAPVEADLQIGKIVARSRHTPVEEVEYMIVAANAGPATVTGATITDVLPASLANAVWTCVADDVGASCGAPGGNGNVSVTANLAVDSSVTILVRADVTSVPFPGIFNTATVAAPAELNDPVPGNDSDTVRYQTCAANAGTVLTAHLCMFRNGFEAP